MKPTEYSHSVSLLAPFTEAKNASQSHAMQRLDCLASKAAFIEFSMFMEGTKIQWKKHTRGTASNCQYWIDTGYIHMPLWIFFFPVTVYICSIISSMKSQRKCLSIAFLLFVWFLSVLVSVLRPLILILIIWKQNTLWKPGTKCFFFYWSFRYLFNFIKVYQDMRFLQILYAWKKFFAFLAKYTTKPGF